MLWGMIFNPLSQSKKKNKFSTKAVEENWKLCFEHDPFFSFATVEKTEIGFRVKEKFNEL